MRKLRVVPLIALVVAALALGITGLVQGVTYAGPQPDCGPSFEWTCVVPGCPDCPEVLFSGTRCEKAQFEKETGRVCSLHFDLAGSPGPLVAGVPAP